MGNRITSEWTKTTTEAFGDNEDTRKGNRAEEIIFEHFLKIYDYAKRNEEDYDLQLEGKDITFGMDHWYRLYNVDVKSNLKDYSFSVDIPKIMKAKTDRWLHYDEKSNFYAMYDINDMKEYIKEKGVEDRPYVYLSTTKAQRPSFIKMGKVS